MAITHDDTFFVIVILGFSAIIFAIFLLYIWSVTTRVPASECPAVAASFGVIQNANPTNLNSCTPTFPSCVINNVNTLTDAITKCDEDANICRAFTYDPTTFQMIIVDPDIPPTSGVAVVYTRLRGVRTLNNK